MAQRSSLAVAIADQPARPSVKNPLTEGLVRLRHEAANSTSAEARRQSLAVLYDIDSFAQVAEASPHPDAREMAKTMLIHRLSSFPDSSLSTMSDEPWSGAIREAALHILAARHPGL